MKHKTARIFIKKINNLVNEFENYISLNELLDSDSDTIHKENLKNTIKDIEDKQEATDPFRLPNVFEDETIKNSILPPQKSTASGQLTDSPLDDLANIVGTKWIKGGW